MGRKRWRVLQSQTVPDEFASDEVTSDDCASDPVPIGGISSLQTTKSTRRLEQIANLRARGVGDHISLPQLVVCGDQSSGKSSVLEGITGIPFPRQDGVCTKFATEIILQHSTDKFVITASILPDSSSLKQRKESMFGFKLELQSFYELPAVISKAGALMGLRGFNGSTDGPAFGRDVLRIHVSGPTGLHLSVVDLPGLIETPNEEQTDNDRDTVHKLADAYLENPRTIILAVVQAGNDIANQPIIRKSKAQDKAGTRTVGIITKPDLVNDGTEGRIALLAKNQDSTKLKLGYFLVKNPAPKALAEGITMEQRLKSEAGFFASSPWKGQGLDPDRIGILALKGYLQNLFDRHIEQHIPQVREEVKLLLKQTERDLQALGETRTSAAHCRAYLSKLSTRFNGLCLSALNGTYQEANGGFFGTKNAELPTRLRAEVHRLNTEFSDYMSDHGEKRTIVSGGSDSDGADDNEADVEGDRSDADDDQSDGILNGSGPHGQMKVTEGQMQEWILEIYKDSRGKELPGTYNYVLLSELFHQQSRPWEQIAVDHIDNLSDKIDAFVKTSLTYLIKDERVLVEVLDLTDEALRTRKGAADGEFELLRNDENQQPITYNHYFTDNVQKSRVAAVQKIIQKHNLAYGNNNSVIQWKNAVSTIVSDLTENIDVDMEQQACSEARAALDSYYKVARKTFVDNICRQVIERHLLQDLPSIFSPDLVAEMEDHELLRIAGELQPSVMKRKELQDLHLQLSQSLKDLRK